MKVTYDQIEPNIAEIDTQGDRVVVTWKCPVSGAVVGETESRMQADQTISAVKSGVTRTILFQGMASVIRVIGQQFGMFGQRVAGAALMPLSAGVASSIGAPVYGEAAHRKAVAAAFLNIQDKFEWDEDRGLFIKAKAPTG